VTSLAVHPSWPCHIFPQSKLSRIKESKEKTPNQRRGRRRENGEEEEILICNINLVSILQGMIEAYI
jgi:hypothetical protein